MDDKPDASHKAGLLARLDAWLARLKIPVPSLSNEEHRKQAWLHFQLIDHAFVRVLWSNMVEIAPGVWRANQPSPARLERWAKKGIRSILNLRGQGGQSHMLFEREACARLGLDLHTIGLSARQLPTRDTLLELVDLMGRIEKPYVIHCKSGSDRTGLAAVLYRMIYLGEPLDAARRELSWRYLHFRNSETGVIDLLFDQYEADTAAAPKPIRDWIAEDYDPAPLTARWNAERGITG